jgi:hypothetical protein
MNLFVTTILGLGIFSERRLDVCDYFAGDTVPRITKRSHPYRIIYISPQLYGGIVYGVNDTKNASAGVIYHVNEAKNPPANLIYRVNGAQNASTDIIYRVNGAQNASTGIIYRVNEAKNALAGIVYCVNHSRTDNN